MRRPVKYSSSLEGISLGAAGRSTGFGIGELSLVTGV